MLDLALGKDQIARRQSASLCLFQNGIRLIEVSKIRQRDGVIARQCGVVFL